MAAPLARLAALLLLGGAVVQVQGQDLCNTHTCPTNYVLIGAAGSTNCAGTPCVSPTDDTTCCIIKALCSTYSSCPSTVLVAASGTTYCAGATCVSTTDDAVCCEPVGHVTKITPPTLLATATQSIALTGSTNGHTAIFASGGSTCNSAAATSTVASYSISVSANTFTAGSYKLCYDDGSIPAFQAGITLVVTDSDPFTFSAVTPIAATVNTATTITLTSSSSLAATGNYVEFAISCAAIANIAVTGDQLGAGTSHSITVTFSSLATYNLCYRAPSKTDTVVQYLDTASYDKVELIVSSAATGGDPVVRFGNTVREFELPPGVLTTLVEAPDLVIKGSVFEGGGPYEQWFNRIVLISTEQSEERFLEIKMKPNLQDFNQSRLRRGEFGTLDVTYGTGLVTKPTFATTVSSINVDIPLGFLGQHIGFRSLRRNHATRIATVGSLPRECADIAGPSLHLYICSSPANEYYGHQRDLSLKYAHLDMLFIEVRDFGSVFGLLPELWGTQPMSATTKSYVKKTTIVGSEAAAPDAADTATQGNASKTAWAGGWGMDDLKEGCLTDAGNDTILSV